MKNFFLILAFCTLASSTTAQRFDRHGRTRVAIGPAIGFPTDHPFKGVPGNKGWGLGAGAMIHVEHFFRHNFSGLVQGGVISFAGRASGPQTKNKAYTTVPIRVGGSGYLGDLHLGAQIGIGFNSFAGDSKTAFAYSPQIGYNFSRDAVPLDFTISYDGYAGSGGFSALIFKLSLVL